MNETEYSAKVHNAIDQPGGVFELRTYVTNPGKLDALNQRFADHTAGLFQKHGMKNFGYWIPFDTPDSQNTLIYLLHHESRQQADANWKAFVSDPDWQKARQESEKNGTILAQAPDRIILRALDFSPTERAKK